MRVKNGLVAATLSGLFLGTIYWGLAQQPANAGGQQSAGGFIPGKSRPPIDPGVVARGKTLFGIHCQGCHGQDLRGGDMGGPNLLRSPVALRDEDGELIVPVIQGARQAMGMPAIGLSSEDAKTVAAYIRSVVAMIGRQGTPPGEHEALNVVVGNADEGRAYFDLKCKSCHSPEGDLHGLASRVPDPKALQNMWVTGHGRGVSEQDPRAVPTATVILPSGEKLEGPLIQIDDFLVSVRLSDGTVRTVRRNGRIPGVIIHNPLKAHADLLPAYTDKDIHDVTAYLVTLK